MRLKNATFVDLFMIIINEYFSQFLTLPCEHAASEQCVCDLFTNPKKILNVQTHNKIKSNNSLKRCNI